MRFDLLVSAASLVSWASAGSSHRSLTSRAAGSDLISQWSKIANSSSTIGNESASDAAAVVSRLTQMQNTHSPDHQTAESAHQEISQRLASSSGSSGGLLTGLVKTLVDVAFIPGELLSLLNGYIELGLNSDSNHNPDPIGHQLYPTKEPVDTPYSVAEEDLRAAIYIPKEFGYGKNGKKPVILVPGTGAPAGLTYYFNFGALGNVANVDVVWVNIPNASLGDAQVNSEYVAYAINYISALSNTKVSVLSWSQGGLNVQWAFKFWPSTRSSTEDFIAISPDFHGSVLLPLVCPLLEDIICTPAFWQQGWNTSFVKTLRENGGDSAYVPTTTVYSSFDEIVEPMGGDHPSGALEDIRGVGVSKNHLQTVCANQSAGGIYTHEGVLYNPLAWALAIDALSHDGPADLSRIDLDSVCAESVPSQFGLGLDQVLGTEGLLLIVVAEAFFYNPKLKSEPPVAGYAAFH